MNPRQPARSRTSPLHALGIALSALLLLASGPARPADTDDSPRRLPMNSAAAHPPFDVVPGYAVATDELARNGLFTEATAAWTSARSDLRAVRSALREGGQAMQVPTSAIQKLPAGTLIAHRAYTLIVKARAGPAAAGPAAGFVSLRFREPRSGNTYRSYREAVSATDYTEYRVDFTAPAFTAMAEIALVANGETMTVDSVSLKMRGPIAVTEAVTSWDQSFTPPGYALVFNDEFSGTQLDRRKWFTRYISNNETLDRLNDEKQRYADNANHAVREGILQLIARKNPLSLPSGINYESGMIRSDWTVRYGFLEARVKMPGGRGVWTAFWLNSDVGESGRINWPPEIDIFEFINNVRDDKVNKLHLAASTPAGTKPVWLYTDPGFRPWAQDWYAPFDFDKGWHTIALDWTPEAISFYVDGLKVMSRVHAWTYADKVEAAPAHILLNFAVGGSWAGRHGIDDSAFPQSMDIDWVRVYRKSERIPQKELRP